MDAEKAAEMPTTDPAESQSNPIPRDRRKAVLHMWAAGIKAILSQGMLPRVMLSIRVDSHLEKKFQLNITYPGLTAKQALPLIGMAFEAVSKKVRDEEMREGPQIIVPR